MNKTKLIEHNGKKIFFMDFSNMKKPEDIATLINESIKHIRKEPPGSVLTLTNIENMHFNNEVISLFSNFLKGNKPYVNAGAVVGISGLARIVYNGVMKVSGRDVRSFENMELAKGWLTSKN